MAFGRLRSSIPTFYLLYQVYYELILYTVSTTGLDATRFFILFILSSYLLQNCWSQWPTKAHMLLSGILTSCKYFLKKKNKTCCHGKLNYKLIQGV